MDGRQDRDFGMIILYFLSAIVLLFEIVTSVITPAWVNIYNNITFFIGFLMIFAYFLGHNSELFDYSFFGNDTSEQVSGDRFFTSMVLAVIIGIALVSYVFTQHFAFLNFNLLPQLAQSFAVSDQISLVQALAVIGLFAAILEEILFRGILQPTLKKWLAKPYGLIMTMFFFGLIIMFLFQAYVIGFFFSALAVGLFAFPTIRNKVLKSAIQITILAIIIQALLFAAFHLKAYSGLVDPQASLIGAFAFGIIAGVIDEMLGNIVPSIIIHSINNVVVFIVLYNIPIINGIFIVGGLMFLLFMAYKWGNKVMKFRFKPQEIINIG